jgi:CubicO group peptidase (beta-lactamase class C family)
LDVVDVEVAEGYIPIKSSEGAISGWKRNIYSTTPEAAADGGATSTAADLVRFAQQLRAGRLLSPHMVAEMTKPKVPMFSEQRRGYFWRYGFAYMFLLDDDGIIIRYGHTGEEDGVSCRLYYYPQQDLDVVILGNQSWCAGDLGWEIHDLLLAEFG